MNSPTRATTTPSNSLPERLEQIGLHAVASGVDDFLARAMLTSQLPVAKWHAHTERALRRFAPI